MDSIAQRCSKEQKAFLKLVTSQGTELAGGTNAALGGDHGRKAAAYGVIAPNASELAPNNFGMTGDESQRFLRIVWKASQIRHHYELFLLLQGEIQHFISHQILIAAWSDFGKPDLTLDVVSALPGVRTGKVNGCGADAQRMLKNLHVRWVANGRRKMLLNNGRVKSITASNCDCALHKAMCGMQSILVHGVHDERDHIDSLYVALDQDSATNGRNVERFFALVDPLVAQIDVAFRNVSALKCAIVPEDAEVVSRSGNLSTREQEVMKWVAQGRTNIEIGGIVGISSFTVKNHMQRIFKKLGATNRTQAVAKYNKCGSGQ